MGNLFIHPTATPSSPVSLPLVLTDNIRFGLLVARLVIIQVFDCALIILEVRTSLLRAKSNRIFHFYEIDARRPNRYLGALTVPALGIETSILKSVQQIGPNFFKRRMSNADTSLSWGIISDCLSISLPHI